MARIQLPCNDSDHQQPPLELLQITKNDEKFDYSKRAQWLRVAILGANDSLVSTALLIMGIGAIKYDIKVVILTGFAGLIAGACSMAIGEFMSMCLQLGIKLSQMKRDKERVRVDEKKKSLPNPLQAASTLALAFSVGVLVPLLAASFIREYKVRLAVIVATFSLALVIFGWLGSVFGKAPVVRSSIRVLIGGWVVMAITFGLIKLIGSSEL